MSKLLTVRQAAERASVSEGLVRAWVKGGELPHRRLGRRPGRGPIRVSEDELLAFLEGRRVEAPRSPATAGVLALSTGDDDFAAYHRRIMTEIARKRLRRERTP